MTIKQTKVDKIFDEHFLSSNNVPKGKLVEIKEGDPEEFITIDRIDLMPKIEFVKDYCNKSYKHNTITDYKEILRAFNDGTFSEPGNPSKNSFEDYVNSFEKLIDNLSENGFNLEESVVPIGDDNTLLDGSHRVAAAYVLDIDVKYVQFDGLKKQYDTEYFKSRGVPISLLEYSVLRFLQISNEHSVFLLWPKLSMKQRREAAEIIRDKFDNIIWEESYIFSTNAIHILNSIAYLDHPWVGSPDNRFKGAKKRAKKTNSKKDPQTITVLIVDECGSNVTNIKEQIRDEFNVGNEGIHSTDSPEESEYLANHLLNENTRHLLNNGEPLKYKGFLNKILNFRLILEESGIQRDEVLVDSSSVLGIYGLRKPNDIDYLSIEDGIEIEPNIYESHNPVSHYYEKSKESMILDTRQHIYIYGLKIMNLENLREGNRNWGENLKKVDISLVDNLIEPKGYRAYWYRFKLFGYLKLFRKLRSTIIFIGELISKKFPIIRKVPHLERIYQFVLKLLR